MATKRLEKLRDQLMAYFGSREEEDEAVAELRADVQSYAETARTLREGLVEALAEDGNDCIDLVEGCANHNVHGSQAEARAWLRDLQAKLFAPRPADG